MTFFIPLGVDEAKVDRIPWISLAIAIACVLAFFATWVVPQNPMGVGDEELGEVLELWFKHPQLELDPAFSEHFLSKQGVEELRRMHERAEAPPEGVDLATLQQELDARCQEMLARSESAAMRRLSLVAARGAAQPGWLTHMFLHFGWMHLLGNLLFFYLVGPLLEDVWGRILFTGFYLVGGLAAALAQFALEPSSQAMMAGASGAVAACIGAFCLRFAGRHVRIGYFIWIVRIWRGTFAMPAWAWGGLWFANEVLDFVLWGNNTGVAVMAHIGGFLFGFAVAMGLRASRVEERYLAPELARRQGAYVEDTRLTQAKEALERGEHEAARTALTAALAARPDAPDALLALGRFELEQGEVQRGMARLERALQLLMGRDDLATLWHALEELGPRLPAARLRPGLAWRLAQALEQAPDGLLPLAEPLYARAGADTGATAARALIRAAELRLAQGEELERAREYVARARRLPLEQNSALGARLQALEAEVESAVARSGPRSPGRLTSSAEPEAPPAPPRIILCRLTSLSERALTVDAGSQRRTLAFTEVLAVAVGLLPAPAPEGAPPRRTLLTDLVISWGEQGGGPVVLRIHAGHLGLPQHYPGLPPRDAYGRLLADLLERSGATAMPDASSLAQGRYPQFASEEALTQHYYAQVV
ncbi:MAG: rhomboid family intramembrane serine protease [Myxococcaceae bacterium]|nr:rhomboid family intramembrane serine protease [Myxococcaceae bacterium]